MNRLLSTLLCGWALLLYPLYSIAESYELSYSIIGTNQKNRPGSRSFKRPLVVDLVGHTLTVPTQVVGYTLMLESEEGELDSVVSHSGIRDRVGNLVFCAEDLYSNRLRLRRRGIGTDDGSVSASDGTGRLLRSWRKHRHRCLRCGRDGCHDTAYHDPGHGSGFEDKSEARSAGRNVRNSWTVRGIRGV